jgi:hypothetical protein
VHPQSTSKVGAHVAASEQRAVPVAHQLGALGPSEYGTSHEVEVEDDVGVGGGSIGAATWA